MYGTSHKFFQFTLAFQISLLKSIMLVWLLPRFMETSCKRTLANTWIRLSLQFLGRLCMIYLLPRFIFSVPFSPHCLIISFSCALSLLSLAVLNKSSRPSVFTTGFSLYGSYTAVPSYNYVIHTLLDFKNLYQLLSQSLFLEGSFLCLKDLPGLSLGLESFILRL